MYDSLSPDYDRFVNWQNRLSFELPFIIQKFQQANTRLALDAATGTGMHAIALAQLGYTTAGADLSAGMIQKAQTNADSAGVQVQFRIAGFGSLAKSFGAQTFDALICLGNSLPHLLSRPDLDAALLDFVQCLKPGGLLLVQNRNFDSIMHQHERWMAPQSHSETGTDWIFQRFYDFDPDGLLTFNMVILKRVDQGDWSQQVIVSRLRPLLQNELLSALAQAGFEDVISYGNMNGDPFDHDTSPNLVLHARLSK